MRLLRGPYVAIAVVLLVEFAAAIGLGSATAQAQKPTFRIAQQVAELPCPEPCPPVMPPIAPPLSTDPPTPVVSISVRAPASAALGQDLDYRLIVENRSAAPAHHVRIRNPLPAHARFVRATPKPDQTDPELLWRLGTLDPGARREIVLVLSPTGSGDVDDCARVQFEHGQCVTTRISRPQLVLRKTGPTEAAVGETLTFGITVTNAGAAEAAGVVLVETLQAGLQLGQQAFDKPVQRTWRLGSLAPGQSRTVDYEATPRVAGRLCSAAEATAAGGLISAPARHCVTVGSRMLTLGIEGPRTAYPKRPVNFFLTVRNEGTLPATNVIVTDPLPEGLAFEQANQGGRRMDGRVIWTLGTLAAGQSRVLQLRVRSDAERELRQVPVATYSAGLKASSEIATRFLGAAGFDFDVTASAYAVEVDTPVRYTVTVFNRGTGSQTNVDIVVDLPAQMEFKEAKAPAGLKYHVEKGTVLFDPLPTLAANADATFEVLAVARKVGDARVQVGMRAGGNERYTYKVVPTQIGEKEPP